MSGHGQFCPVAKAMQVLDERGTALVERVDPGNGPCCGALRVVTDGDVDTCDFDPEYDVMATVHTSLRTLTESQRGDTPCEPALGNGAVRIEAPSETRRSFARLFGQGDFADVPRVA